MGGVEIKLPEDLVLERKKAFRLMIDPKRIEIAVSNPEVEPHKLYKGTVKQVTAESNNVHAVVDIGVPLSLVMDREKYLQNPPVVGEGVKIVIPPDAVHII